VRRHRASYPFSDDAQCTALEAKHSYLNVAETYREVWLAQAANEGPVPGFRFKLGRLG
jgi:hypothetical protein